MRCFDSHIQILRRTTRTVFVRIFFIQKVISQNQPKVFPAPVLKYPYNYFCYEPSSDSTRAIFFFEFMSTKKSCKTVKRLKVRNFESWKGAATPHRILCNLFRLPKNEVNKYYFSSRKITE
jgi:hypothetical protein